MTKEALIERLKTLAEWDDNEAAHIEADDALIEYIDDNDVKEAFDSIRKWYA